MLSKRLLLYYLSPAITDVSPPLSCMQTIAADSPTEAAQKLLQEGRIPTGVAVNWAHFVAAIDDGGIPRGFNSVELSSVKMASYERCR
jgi:hypothetical protein